MDGATCRDEGVRESLEVATRVQVQLVGEAHTGGDGEGQAGLVDDRRGQPEALRRHRLVLHGTDRSGVVRGRVDEGVRAGRRAVDGQLVGEVGDKVDAGPVRVGVLAGPVDAGPLDEVGIDQRVLCRHLARRVAGGPVTDPTGLEHDDAHARPCGEQGGGQPRDAGAHDDDVGLGVALQPGSRLPALAGDRRATRCHACLPECS